MFLPATELLLPPTRERFGPGSWIAGEENSKDGVAVPPDR